MEEGCLQTCSSWLAQQPRVTCSEMGMPTTSGPSISIAIPMLSRKCLIEFPTGQSDGDIFSSTFLTGACEKLTRQNKPTKQTTSTSTETESLKCLSSHSLEHHVYIIFNIGFQIVVSFPESSIRELLCSC